jgi:hypothetical protein
MRAALEDEDAGERTRDCAAAVRNEPKIEAAAGRARVDDPAQVAVRADRSQRIAPSQRDEVLPMLDRRLPGSRAPPRKLALRARSDDASPRSGSDGTGRKALALPERRSTIATPACPKAAPA